MASRIGKLGPSNWLVNAGKVWPHRGVAEQTIGPECGICTPYGVRVGV